MRQLLAYTLLLGLLVTKLFCTRLVLPVLFCELLFQPVYLLVQFGSVLFRLKLKFFNV